MITLKHVVVATDFGDPAAVALDYGRELARTFSAQLHLVHVVDDIAAHAVGFPTYIPNLTQLQTNAEQEARARLDERLFEEDRRALSARSVVLTSRSAAQAIVDFARDLPADLLVVGTHGRSGMAHLVMGSVAERVVRLGPCPVLTVRHPEREFVRPDALTVASQA
jgi:nucleotide-binding universal stress UspA family protein